MIGIRDGADPGVDDSILELEGIDIDRSHGAGTKTALRDELGLDAPSGD